jgi:peroxiredoxin
MSIALGSPAPDFTLTEVNGATRSLADYANASILVLVQSCNHCPYVLAWEGRLASIASEYAARGVVVVATNANDAARYPEDSFSRMQEHAREQAFPFDYLHDEQQELATALGAERTPEVFVFDSARQLAYHGAIDDNRDEDAVTEHFLRNALGALIAGAPIPTPETAPVGCSVKWRE